MNALIPCFTCLKNVNIRIVNVKCNLCLGRVGYAQVYPITRSVHACFIFVLLLVGINCFGQQTHEQLIHSYFDAFNRSSFTKLNHAVSDDFTMSEGDFTICRNRTEFYTVFKWDSIFIPKYEVKSVQIDASGANVEVAKLDKRVQFLHDDPMVSVVRFRIERGKIKSLTINDYKKFDVAKWQGRLKNLKEWVSKNNTELNGFERDITPQGAKNYIKAIEWYSNRKLTNEEEIFIDKDIQLVHLKDSVFVHITWDSLSEYGLFSSNGLIMVKDGKAIMVDTPMDNDKTERLYSYLKDKMNIKVNRLILGHFHDDCMGGIGFLHGQGVHSIVNDLTKEKCITDGLPIPTQSFKDSLKLNFNGVPVVCRFFGGGHSFDNITVWLPNNKILFGGCLVKSASAKGLGNLSDAVVDDWDTTIGKIQVAYPEVKIIVPGHGDYGGGELLNHTIELVKNYKQQNEF